MANPSQRKGKNYERYIAKIFSTVLNINVRRTPGSGNLDIKGDLRNLSGVLENWVFECKKQEKLNIWKAIQQAKLEAGYKNWAVVFSRNREEDYICMSIHDFLGLIQKEDEK